MLRVIIALLLLLLLLFLITDIHMYLNHFPRSFLSSLPPPSLLPVSSLLPSSLLLQNINKERSGDLQKAYA